MSSANDISRRQKCQDKPYHFRMFSSFKVKLYPQKRWSFTGQYVETPKAITEEKVVLMFYQTRYVETRMKETWIGADGQWNYVDIIIEKEKENRRTLKCLKTWSKRDFVNESDYWKGNKLVMAFVKKIIDKYIKYITVHNSVHSWINKQFVRKTRRETTHATDTTRC